MSFLRWLLALVSAVTAMLTSFTPLAAQENSYGTGTGALATAATGDSFKGSVPAVKGAPGVLGLSLRRAIALGLANNLGLLLQKDGTLSARGQRWIELSKLLPNLSSSASVHHLKESLAITGISLPGVPPVVGPWYCSLWESTDDAQIDGHLNQISARISGQVLKVRFDDNQFVKAGTVLVEIDRTDYQVAYERALAELAEARTAANAARVGVPIDHLG